MSSDGEEILDPQ